MPAYRRRSRRDKIIRTLSRFAARAGAFFSDPLRRFQVSLWFLFLFLVIGVVGYMIIEQMTPIDALYMTVITVTTVGFGDVVPTNQASRVFTIVLIFLGIGAATTAVSNAIDAFVGQRLWGAVRLRRIEELLKTMENHYIVSGYGRIGQQIVRDILIRGETCLVIDSDPSVQTDEFLLEENVPFVIGDATDDHLLERAGVRRAKGFIAALPSDADNVLAILTARGLKEDLFIVARSANIGSENKLRRAGADHVVSPYQVGGHRMAMALLRPAVHAFMNHLSDMSDSESYDIGQIVIQEGSRLVGQTPRTSDLREVRGLSILAVITGGELKINPPPHWEFQVGEQLVVIGPPASIYGIEEIYGTDDVV